MKPVVEAALISGGWATVVAALGFVFNRVTANATIRATNANALAALDAAHSAQLWDKRAETYVETLAVLSRRQVERQHMASPLRYNEATEAKLRQTYADPEDWDWSAASAKLTAYASRPVLDAARTAQNANADVRAKVEDFALLQKRAESLGPGRPDREVPAAWREIETALAAAKAADDALEALIRADLARRPSESTARHGLTPGPDTALPPNG